MDGATSLLYPLMTEDEAIRILWDFHHVGHTLAPCDLIFVLGSNDARVAEYAAELYHRGLAPYIVFSGGAGRFTQGWQLTEAEIFAKAAQTKGVPSEAILLENKATNTGENIRFSRQIIREAGKPEPSRILALQKPYMERRTLATLEAQWPGPTFLVSSPALSFDAYLTETLTRPFVINAMMGDFQRIIEYPKQGFSTPQHITSEALEAFRYLTQSGYTTQLLPGIPLP